MTQIQTKWTAFFFLIAFVVAIFFLDQKVKADHHAFYEQKFSLLASLRKSALEAYLETVESELGFWVNSELLEKVSRELDAGWYALPGDHKKYLQQRYVHQNPYPENERWKLLNAEDGTAYSEAHIKVHKLAHEFVEERGYHDLLLIDLEGNIIYSVDKKPDFGENVLNGSLRDSELSKVYKEALADESDFVHYTDFSAYAPNNNLPTVFIARRMHDENQKVDGVVAIEIDTSSIMEIMQAANGMGESGETYLVGEDLLMRSDSRFSAESSVLKTKVDSHTVMKALQGQSGVDITPDYRGIPVLSAYDYIDVGDFRWALMSEIDEAEIQKTNPISTWTIVLTTFIAYIAGLLLSLVSGRFENNGEDDIDMEMMEGLG